jgi:maltooligosyltrehalose trehalohydrolase
VLGDTVFLLRWSGELQPDRLLLVNLGSDLVLEVVSEPLLAPPAGMVWEIRWSSEDPAYGGTGLPPLESDAGWRLPAESAVLLDARRREGA